MDSLWNKAAKAEKKNSLGPKCFLLLKKRVLGVGGGGKRVWLIWCMDGNVTEREWEPLVQLNHKFKLTPLFFIVYVCVSWVCVSCVCGACVCGLCVWRARVCVCSFIRIEAQNIIRCTLRSPPLAIFAYRAHKKMRLKKYCWGYQFLLAAPNKRALTKIWPPSNEKKQTKKLIVVASFRNDHVITTDTTHDMRGIDAAPFNSDNVRAMMQLSVKQLRFSDCFRGKRMQKRTLVTR